MTQEGSLGFLTPTPKLDPRVAGAVEVQARAEDGWLVGLVFGLEVLNLV